MAAREAFNNFLNILSLESKDKLRDFIDSRRAEMFAARSEDERSRITDEFVREVRDRLKKGKLTS